jgi:hypothetical protein
VYSLERRAFGGKRQKREMKEQKEVILSSANSFQQNNKQQILAQNEDTREFSKCAFYFKLVREKGGDNESRRKQSYSSPGGKQARIFFSFLAAFLARPFFFLLQPCSPCLQFIPCSYSQTFIIYPFLPIINLYSLSFHSSNVPLDHPDRQQQKQTRLFSASDNCAAHTPHDAVYASGGGYFDGHGVPTNDRAVSLFCSLWMVPLLLTKIILLTTGK